MGGPSGFTMHRMHVASELARSLYFQYTAISFVKTESHHWNKPEESRNCDQCTTCVLHFSSSKTGICGRLHKELRAEDIPSVTTLDIMKNVPTQTETPFPTNVFLTLSRQPLTPCQIKGGVVAINPLQVLYALPE